MKKIMIFALVALAMCACDNKKKEFNEQLLQNDSLRSIVSQQENEINDLMSVLNEVQEGFAAINAAEGRITVERQQGENGNRETMRENIAEIQRTLQMNRELIGNLRQQLKESNIYSQQLKTTLEATIENLTKEMEAKTAEIQRLNEEIAKRDATIADQRVAISDLNTNVKDLSDQNDKKAQTVAQQDKDLHTAYYVFGTKKELKEQSILDGGDVLRSGNFSKDYFTKIDIRTMKSIRLYSKTAKLLTSHPAGSYSLDKDNQGQYTLRITDADRFWSISKYLVVLVK